MATSRPPDASGVAHEHLRTRKYDPAHGESIFVADGDRFVPTEHARGPWDPRALHGGAPAALIAAAFERMQPGAELPFARLSFEFLRPVPMAPLKLSTRISRPGRRVQALEAELSADGRDGVSRERAAPRADARGACRELALAQVEAARPRDDRARIRGRASALCAR